MVRRVSVPFPVMLLWYRGKAKYGTGRKIASYQQVTFLVVCNGEKLTAMEATKVGTFPAIGIFLRQFNVKYLMTAV
jgi:hypothetical protein